MIIPDGVVKIGDDVFTEREDITSVVIPEGVTTIGVGAFSKCMALHNVTFPSTLKTINESAFYFNKALEEIVLPEGLTTIERYAFYLCSELVKVEIPESVTHFGYGSFCETRWITRTANQKKKDGELPIVVVNGVLIDGCFLSGDVVLPEGIKEIASNSFSKYGLEYIYGDEPLTSIILPSGLETIGSLALKL